MRNAWMGLGLVGLAACAPADVGEYVGQYEMLEHSEFRAKSNVGKQLEDPAGRTFKMAGSHPDGPSITKFEVRHQDGVLEVVPAKKVTRHAMSSVTHFMADELDGPVARSFEWESDGGNFWCEATVWMTQFEAFDGEIEVTRWTYEPAGFFTGDDLEPCLRGDFRGVDASDVLDPQGNVKWVLKHMELLHGEKKEKVSLF